MSQVQLTEEDILQDMEESGTNYAVLQGERDLGDYRKQNDAVYDLARKHPDKFVLTTYA